MRFAEEIRYMLSNATFTEEEYADMIRKMSTQASQTTRSFADLMFAKGEAQGEERGKEIGQIAMLVRVIHKRPDWSDQQAAEFFGVDIELVRKARQSNGAAG